MLNIKFSKDNFPTEEGLYLVKHDVSNGINLLYVFKACDKLYFNDTKLEIIKDTHSFSEKLSVDDINLKSI